MHSCIATRVINFSQSSIYLSTYLPIYPIPPNHTAKNTKKREREGERERESHDDYSRLIDTAAMNVTAARPEDHDCDQMIRCQDPQITTRHPSPSPFSLLNDYQYHHFHEPPLSPPLTTFKVNITPSHLAHYIYRLRHRLRPRV